MSFLSSIAGDTPLGLLNQGENAGIQSVTGDPNGIGDMLTGGAVSNAQSVAATNQVNTQNALQAEQYNTQMSDTSYQRGVQDMKAAGLNPMLAYSQGGDSTPSAVMPQISAPQTGDIGAGLANSAKDVFSGSLSSQSNSRSDAAQSNQDMTTAASVKATQANTENTDADTDNKIIDRNTHQNDSKISDEKYKQSREATKQARNKTRVSASDADSSEMDRDVQKARYGVDKKLAPWNAGADIAHKVSGTVSNALGAYNKASTAVDPGGLADKAFRNNAKRWLWREGEVP